MHSLVAMAPTGSLSKISAGILPFNPFVPRASWVVKKSILSDALTPAMIKALSSLGVVFTRSPLPKESLPGQQLSEKVSVVSIPNFSLIVRALPVEQRFELDPLITQELAHYKNKSLASVQPVLPVIKVSCVDRGGDFLLTMNSTQENVVGGMARVQTEMSVTQASWLRVTRPMLIFSLIDGLFRSTLITSLDSKLAFGDLNYEVGVIVDKGLLCGVEQQTQTRKFSRSEGTQTKGPKSKQTQTRNLKTGGLFGISKVDNAQTQTDFLKDQETQTRNIETGSLFDVKIVDNAQTQTDFSKDKRIQTVVPSEQKQVVVARTLPRKQTQMRSQSYCGIMEYIFIALFLVMFGLSDYKSYGPSVAH
jgi:hypothetical protein